MNYNKINLPKHIGIIMDGNGRWATKRHLPRLSGHKAGVESVREIVEFSNELGIKYITFFAFSTENWKRDKTEIDGIFQIVRDYVNQQLENFDSQGIKLLSIGDISKIPQDLQEKLEEVKEKTKDNTKMVLTLAINYGARDEILRACNTLIEKGVKKVSIQDFEKELYTYGLPDPDLVIRTSGEQRLSNFMLYQLAYSELYFTKTLWPSFNKKHLLKAIKDYSKRERRFGSNSQAKK